ncbi:HNH endonuclease [Sporomusa ovata]|uniref:HNH endonuclease n=1 Tax=Sporomusa ovata TaxID=2378 RepID=UPI0008FBEC74
MKVTPIPKTPRIHDKNCIDKIRAIGHCEVCGSSYLLQVHHIKSRGSNGGDTEDNTVCLCWICHRKAHSGEISKETLLHIVGRRRRCLTF